jgi:ATP-dependent helicase HrpA
MIGHTQPRRIAARSVAERIAQELAVPLGGLVGYQVRFTDRVSDDTQVKVMTDGVLLAEIQRDRLLTRYDTISSTRPMSGASTSISCSGTCTSCFPADPTSS